MTQSKPKPKPTPKKLSPIDQFHKLLDKCSDDELRGLAKEIDQLLWERQLVAKPLASLAQGEVGVDGFVFLKELRQELTNKYERKKSSQ